MDIDLPSNTFPSASSTEPMFTPGGKRKRGFEQDVMQDHVPGQTLDEGSAAKQLRTLPPSAFDPTPISPFPFSQSQSQSQAQTPNTDVFGSQPIFPSTHSTPNHNPLGSSADYFSRPLAPLHDQSAPRLLNLTPDPNLGTNQLAVQSFSQDLFPPPSSASTASGSRVGLMQPRSNIQGGNAPAGLNGSGAGVGVMMTPGAGMSGINDGSGMNGDQGMMLDAESGTASTPGLVEEVEKARNVHGPQCKTIPRLFLSDHPDPVTGKRSMWAQCNSCGSIEMVPDQA